MTFREYVQGARLTPNARGDFLREARCDRRMPDDFQTLGQLLSYVRRDRRDCQDVIEGATSAWNSYQQKLQRDALAG